MNTNEIKDLIAIEFNKHSKIFSDAIHDTRRILIETGLYREAQSKFEKIDNVNVRLKWTPEKIENISELYKIINKKLDLLIDHLGLEYHPEELTKPRFEKKKK